MLKIFYYNKRGCRNIRIAAALFFAFYFSPPDSCSSAAEENTENLMVRAMQLRDDNKGNEALSLFEAVLQIDPDNYQALINAAFMHLRLGWLYSDKSGKKFHYFKLRDYALRAVKQNPMEYQAILINIVAKAKTAGYLSPGHQVRIARELQVELETLMASGRNDPDTIYILSWLNFKVGKIGALEKLFASIFLGGLPENLTTEKALELMKKAIELRPDYSIYHYDLGLFWQRLGQFERAKSLFETVLSMTPKKPEETVYRQWAVHRLNELAGQKGGGN